MVFTCISAAGAPKSLSSRNQRWCPYLILEDTWPGRENNQIISNNKLYLSESKFF